MEEKQLKGEKETIDFTGENKSTEENEDGKAGFCLSIVMVISSRLLYLLHALLAVWRVTVVLGNAFWFLATGTSLFFLDAAFVLIKRKGREWTWFQPIVLFYMMVTLPSIWLLELQKASIVQVTSNQTAILGSLIQNSGTDHLASIVSISNDLWALLLEQSMLVIIIIARWMMPKGALSRDQLSALLLAYLGIASDVVDFFSVLAESNTLLLDIIFVFTILSTWSWSMLQFIFVTSMTHSNEEDDHHKHIHKILEDESSFTEDNDTNHTKQITCTSKLRILVESEIWSILVSILMQDGPYVVVRLACVFYWSIRTYTNYFFTAKNCLVLVLQVYRLIVLYHEHHNQKVEKEHKKKQTQKKLAAFFNKLAPTNGVRRRISEGSKNVVPINETGKVKQNITTDNDDIRTGEVKQNFTGNNDTHVNPVSACDW